MQVPLSIVLRDSLAVLTFRRPSAAVGRFWQTYLAYGLACTWLAGMGRYWDNPKAEWYQSAGLGSVAYVFVLALILTNNLAPLRPRHWSYRNVLVFVTLTSPPALLYAIPVERWLSMEDAARANVWFLGTVATWRVALLAWFLRSVGGLSGFAIVVGTLLPLSLIVVVLSILNLEHVVFNLMAGIEPHERTANDAAYFFVVELAMWSMVALPFLLVAYGYLSKKAGQAESVDG